ncbi:MAG: SapC family protein [Gammaproteobacteria bacterium]|nr:SapC family protein [Gammaproteobacteria bacterium]
MATPAPQLPVFYRDVVALSRERHKDWYIDPEQGYSFAASSNSVYVAASEFVVAAREFPIVFARDAGGGLAPAVLLGLRANENVVVDEEGRWLTNYVPAYVRRYPFILATAADGGDQLTVCIDEAYSGFNTAQEGQRLIAEDGEHGELLSNSVNFLREFHQHTLLTREFCQAVDQAGLLEPMQANVAMNSGEKFSLSGLHCVTRARLKTLEAAVAKQFLDKDYLELIYLHMHSLANLDRLVQGVAARSGTPAQ